MKSRRGFTLIELLLVGVLVGVVFNLLAAVLVMNFRMSAVGTKQLLHSHERMRIDDQFVESVRNARRIVPNHGEFETNDRQLVLERSNGSHVVFGPFGTDGRLARLVLRDDDKPGAMTVYQRDIDEYVFEQNGALVTLRVRFANDSSGVEHVVRAAMRNAGSAP